MTRLTSGETFAGYRIISVLGVGGMGEVYLAEHPRLPRRDALKLLRLDTSADPEFRARFLREADLASGLWHPNIVGVHDRGDVDGRLWIAMDFIDGQDAGRLLARQYPSGMAKELVVAIVGAIASALDYANDRGLLHRDVKPANIMLTDIDEPKTRRILLTDFGIARGADDELELTSAEMAVGTVAYTAPEQLLGYQIDGRADQYALAATAYHLLSGETLFPNANPATIISSHLHTAPPPLHVRRPDLVALEPVLTRALAKDPASRYPCCEDFAAALARAAEQEPATVAVPRPVPAAAPPGWYPDPSGQLDQRFWDGQQWHDGAEPPTTGIAVSRRGFIAVGLIAAASATTFVVVRRIRDGAATSPVASPPPPPPPSPAPPEPPPEVALGSALVVASRTGQARYTVSNIRPVKPLNPALVTGVLYAADVTVESRSGIIKVTPGQFSARSAEGKHLAWSNNVANALPIADVAEGQTLSGPIAFDVPPGAQIAEIILGGFLGNQIGVWKV